MKSLHATTNRALLSALLLVLCAGIVAGCTESDEPFFDDLPLLDELVEEEMGESLPAVVAVGVRTVSEVLGVPEMEVEVISFNETEWPDGCLGLGEADEICTQALIPGWSIILRVEGQEYEVRTDWTGSHVRWRSR